MTSLVSPAIHHGPAFELVSPIDDTAYAAAMPMPPNEVPDVVAAGREAQSRLASRDERLGIIGRLRALIETSAHELEHVLVTSIGKPRHEAASEVRESISYLAALERLASDAFVNSRSETGYARGSLDMTPLGVAAIFVPWNYPVVLGAIKIGQSLAAGCPVVVKASPRAIAPTLALGSLAAQAARSAGIVQVVIGGAELGEELIDRADIVVFTGSTMVGRRVAERAARGLKPAILELGGKCAQLVLSGAALSENHEQIVAAALENAGQNCQAGSRVIVPREMLPAAVDALASAIRSNWVAADPRRAETKLGPLVDAAHAQHVRQVLVSAAEAGLEIRRGRAQQTGTAYVAPAAIVLPDASSRDGWPWFREEIFGPVVTIEAADDEEQAVALANEPGYGIAAAIWGDVERARLLAERLRVGVVWINQYGSTPWEWPMQATGLSGWGIELGIEGIRAMSRYRQTWWQDESPRPTGRPTPERSGG